MVYKYSGSGKERIPAFEDITWLQWEFPLFSKHFKLLKNAGVITRKGVDDYQWNYSNSSMAQYFVFIAEKKRQNMEWGMIESTFKVKPGTLRRLASTNGNTYKLDNPEWKSKDFEKILRIVFNKA